MSAVYVALTDGEEKIWNNGFLFTEEANVIRVFDEQNELLARYSAKDVRTIKYVPKED